jgi:hypothetical protein
VAVARPSLDDVYLRHTGRSYSETATASADRTDRTDRTENELVEASK